MSNELLVFPHPQQGQSVDCYIRHLAEENGFPNAFAMLREFVGARGPFSDKITFEQLEKITGLGGVVLAEAQLTLIEEHGYPIYRYKNVVIPSYQLRAGEWHCPHCYEETGYINGSWRIAWLPACTKHECLLEPFDQACEVEASARNRDHFLLHAANDGPVSSEAIEVQILLETMLSEEAFCMKALPIEDSVVKLIDTFLLRALGLSDVGELQNRKRRYPLRYFPLGFEDTLKFMECLYVQLIASKRHCA